MRALRMRTVTLLAFAAAAACARRSPSDVPRPNPAEVAALANRDRRVGRLIDKAEGAVQAGRLADAANDYDDLRALLPSSGFPDRRRCQILAALGQKAKAQSACGRAVERGSSVPDLRASVGVAMMPDKDAPTVDQVVNAVMVAAGAQRQLPSQTFGYAAYADIARRVGDWDMMRTQLAELDRVAPLSDETRRARAQMVQPWTWWRSLGLGTLTLAGVVAAARAFRRWWRLRARASRAAVAALVVTLAGLAHAAGAANAASAPAKTKATEKAAAVPLDVDKPPEVNAFSRFQIDDADPAGTLPLDQANSDPLQFAYLLMDITGKAEDAAKRGDHHTAIKYYRALAKAVPHRSISHSRICRSYEALGDRTNALDACRSAMGSEGVELGDYQRFVALVLNHPEAPTVREKDDILAVIKHLRAGPPASVLVADDVQCQFATRIGDTGLLEGCVAGLVNAVPKEGKTIAYQWSLAMAKGNRDEAARLVQRAKFAGVKPDGIAKMTAATKAMNTRRWVAPLWAGGAVGATLLIVAAFLLLRRSRAGQQTVQNPA